MGEVANQGTATRIAAEDLHGVGTTHMTKGKKTIRPQAWRKTDGGPSRRLRQILDAVAYTTAAATLGAVAIFILAWYYVQ